MNYELAKELEEAGFPRASGQMMHDHTVTPAQHYYNPTLEELIDACGPAFRALHSPQDMEVESWVAGTMDKRFTEGKTPTEAVARLWLSLNKNV